MASFLSFIFAHSGEAADPELIHWIKERLDQLLGPGGPWTVVVVMGLIILAMPVFVVVVYLLQAKRRSAAAGLLDQDGP
ncbi:MAG: hypothetical protein HQ475_11655 [SAR202 cluster bacterium]|nr:hypothetical protein [SAR202 cluster bacterium]